MTTKIKLLAWMSLLTLFFATSCGQGKQQDNSAAKATTETESMDTDFEWKKNANIYEVNVRQYTPEGTFKAFATHLPRLKKMGVGILWFMPISPISESRRKGPLGSYYAISDYTKVNPEFGTLEDFKAVINKAHEMGMKVILDWVPNHTGWDHHWIKDHPDWYTRDEKGEIIEAPEDSDWTDVADLNYDNADLRKQMIADMKYWVEEHDVDGFRCDVAERVPIDFWEQAIPELRNAKSDLFMLAEAEVPEHRNIEGLFDMSYGWSFKDLINAIPTGEHGANDIDTWLKDDRARFKKGYHMMFITNHDENSWNGTIEERLGDAADAMAVLAFTFDGMPLIYSGQEADNKKRIEFFKKDTIQWGDFSKEAFYTTLLNLKHKHKALWNGDWGGEPIRIKTDKDDAVYAFYRKKGEDTVLVAINLSDENQSINLKTSYLSGEYTNLFENRSVSVGEEMEATLNPWGYLVLTKL